MKRGREPCGRATETSTAPRRILVIGSPGAGKSVLAARLSRDLGAPRVDLDALFWRPGWRKVPEDRFLAEVEHATAGDRWIVDGIYPGALARLVDVADVVIWLDLPLRTLTARVLLRSARRIIGRESICGGNRERWRDLFGPDSLPLYLLRRHHGLRRTFATLISAEGRPHGQQVVCLRSGAQVRAWLVGRPGHSNQRCHSVPLTEGDQPCSNG